MKVKTLTEEVEGHNRALNLGTRTETPIASTIGIYAKASWNLMFHSKTCCCRDCGALRLICN